MELFEKFKSGDYWGIECLVNLVECDVNLISNSVTLERFVEELCDEINMNMVGPTILKRFGSDHLYGYTLMQMIETSSIIGHFSEDNGDAYIDIFSCKAFNPHEAAEFCKNFFGAKDVQYMTILRDTKLGGK